MKKLALPLLLVLGCSVLGCTVLALAAARTTATVADVPQPAKPAAEATKTGSTTGTAQDRGLPSKSGAPSTPVHTPTARDGAKTGDIIIKGKAGSVTSISYGDSAKPEAGEAKTSGQ